MAAARRARLATSKIVVHRHWLDPAQRSALSAAARMAGYRDAELSFVSEDDFVITKVATNILDSNEIPCESE